MHWQEIVGWLGTGLIVLAYFLVSTKRLAPTDRSYQLLNLLGAVGIGVNSYFHLAWPSVGLQAVWLLIAIFALIKHSTN